MVVAEALRAHIEAADGRPDGLLAVFASLQSEVGTHRASRLWWAIFAETDAAPT